MNEYPNPKPVKSRMPLQKGPTRRRSSERYGLLHHVSYRSRGLGGDTPNRMRCPLGLRLSSFPLSTRSCRQANVRLCVPAEQSGAGMTKKRAWLVGITASMGIVTLAAGTLLYWFYYTWDATAIEPYR